MADDECIVLDDSDEEQPAAPAAKRARSAAADADVELVDAAPAPLQADDSADGSDEDEDVRVVGTKGEVRLTGPCFAAPDGRLGRLVCFGTSSISVCSAGSTASADLHMPLRAERGAACAHARAALATGRFGCARC